MILGVESSCDESALALFRRDQGLLGEWVSSQVSLHSEYGGVVPDLASREHLSNFGPLLEEAKRSFDFSDIEEIAVTTGPGLAGCLAMGISTAKALSLAFDAPVYAVNHLRAHAHSVFIATHENDPRGFDTALQELLPHLSLVVSGGNTLLARIDEDKSLALLGQTIDDAAGEALDKGAKLMGFGYPGGPKLEQQAREGDSQAHDFPRALLHKDNLDFSFSGLKTSLRYRIDEYEEKDLQEALPDLCASYQEAVIDVLAKKASRALKESNFKSIGLSGGVSNNLVLRERLEGLGERYGISCLLAAPRHTGDNAGMIAFSHFFELANKQATELSIEPSLPIQQRA